MKWQIIFLLLMGIKWRFVCSTCVFESDFGFTLNCGFKKSSMFRVRNLGGLKSYFGLGFSLGDELGFKESLSAAEPTNRRRSAAGYFAPLLNTTSQSRSFTESSSLPKPSLTWSQVESNKTNRSGHAIKLRSPVRHKMIASLINSVPPFRPIAPAGGVPDLSKSNRPIRITKTRDEDPVTVVAVPAFAALPQSVAKIEHIAPSSSSNTNNRRISYTSLMGQRSEVADISNSLSTVTHSTPTSTSADSLLPDAVEHALKNVAHATNISADALLASIQIRQQQILYQQQKQLAALAATPSTTAATETSSAKTVPASIPIVVADAVVDHGHPIIVTAPLTNGGLLNMAPHRVNNLNPIAVQPTAAVPAVSQPYPTYPAPIADTSNSIEYSPPPPPPPSPSPLTLSRPQRQKYTMAGAHKVMNAPKEYYPINYDKNFDDNFTSRVELPDTPFNCGDQKHFPGLYADEDLNCMVFHVCALTDEGLVMKSFLCPESTLFDQTILKCNWWFYVDCKASKKLYDSNIPISKSYQLMKALTFFSSYSKNEKSS